MITLSMSKWACVPVSHTDPRVLTAEPNSIVETQSPLLCSSFGEQDCRKCRHRVISGDVSEQISLRAVVSSFIVQIPIPVPIPCFSSCPVVCAFSEGAFEEILASK